MAAANGDDVVLSDDTDAPDEDELVAEKEILNEDVPEEEEVEGEDLMENIEKDYAPDEILDKYDENQLDNRKFPEMSARDRLRAEKEMRQRDRQERARALRTPAALAVGDDDDEDKRVQIRPHRRRRREEEPAAREPALSGIADEVPEEEVVLPMDVSQSDGMRKQLQIVATRAAVASKFRRFLTTYTDQEKKGGVVYPERIKNMCAANRESLEVSYRHLSKCEDTTLALWLAEAPTEMLKIFDEEAMNLVLNIFPEYRRIKPEIHVRITDFGVIDQLRSIRQVHLDAMVRVPGVVTRRTGVFPHLKYVRYDCGKCGQVLGPFTQTLEQEVRHLSCPGCQSKGPFLVNTEQTVYRSYQRITLQESPGSVPAGRLPRTKEVILLGDLIDVARPGEEIEVTGVYRNNYDVGLNHLHGFPVFATVIEANSIAKKDDAFASFRLNDEDEKLIRKVSKDPNVGDKIVNSIAPSIFGHEDIKLALALALFGSDPVTVKEHKTRGDINVLLLGDPGTAKSQFLKYLEKTSHRAVYATGQGASAVGLTAAVRKDPITREYTLEGGALVLADKGMCLIDEFDKMNDKDRTSIHEAMEQQSISITKAGICATLSARCSVIAAANPLRGRYDTQYPLALNVDLTEPILSRFDVLCVVRDQPDKQKDEMLASFVVASHVRSHPSNRDNNALKEREESYNPDADYFPQALLRKYIVYARNKCHPYYSGAERDRVSEAYERLRAEVQHNGGIPVGVRHLEAIFRMACAHARMHLRDTVNDEDVNVALKVMLESFITSQKLALTSHMRKTFAKYLNYKTDNDQLLNHLLHTMVVEEVQLKQSTRNRKEPVSESEVEVKVMHFEERARAAGINDPKPYYASALFRRSYDMDSKKGIIKPKAKR